VNALHQDGVARLRNCCHQALLGLGFVDLDKNLPMLLLDERTHGQRPDLVLRLRHSGAAFFRRVALVLGLDQDQVETFRGPNVIPARDRIRELSANVFDQVIMKIPPQPATLDVGVHPRKR
jgi:hypothetical protein